MNDLTENSRFLLFLFIFFFISTILICLCDLNDNNI